MVWKEAKIELFVQFFHSNTVMTSFAGCKALIREKQGILSWSSGLSSKCVDFFFLMGLSLFLLKNIFIVFFPLPVSPHVPPRPHNRHTVVHVHENVFAFKFSSLLHLLRESPEIGLQVKITDLDAHLLPTLMNEFNT